MNKNVLGLVLIPFILSGCVKKAEEKTTEKIEKTPTTKVKEPPPKEENVIPAMIVRNFVVKFEQPKICGPNPDVEGIVCTSKEAIALKSNINWIDQIIDKEIRKDYADALTPPSEKQKQLNQTQAEGLNNWSDSVVYRFNGQFGQYVQLSKVSSEYSGGAHGISTFEDYVFDLKSKKRIGLKDIVVTGKMNALKDELWKQYEYWCQEKDMEPYISKEDFKVSENFYINQSGGITFDFQLYELAPYVLGPVSLELHDTDQLIKPEFSPPRPVLKTEV
ncbi:putative lipoprotein [Acinetobacter baumannii]|uniref:RsiV family protein n=1 Tax=Acinetobacter baumannii TaxID=470 RepID=UPI000DE78304|nr:RsiV family protein [Acinetobacter baumannii]SSM53294.1 putative lipoprotein [Acinetobacter baumannii]SSM53388.1 putative lipoprotein [Acinetobacter baumannii]SSM95233.1 putative lipoprotein [Acinetobacter baumannii]SSN33759.1 putative lipoprotein [Acinetobacter baumannii]